MTGYAQARAEGQGWLLRASVRSVNHRFLDLRVRIPDGREGVAVDVDETGALLVDAGHGVLARVVSSADPGERSA